MRGRHSFISPLIIRVGNPNLQRKKWNLFNLLISSEISSIYDVSTLSEDTLRKILRTKTIGGSSIWTKKFDQDQDKFAVSPSRESKNFDNMGGVLALG